MNANEKVTLIKLRRSKYLTLQAEINKFLHMFAVVRVIAKINLLFFLKFCKIQNMYNLMEYIISILNIYFTFYFLEFPANTSFPKNFHT